MANRRFNPNKIPADDEVKIWLIERRFTQKILRKREKQNQKRILHEQYINLIASIKKEGKKPSKSEITRSWLPANISYLISCNESPFHLKKLALNAPKNNGYFIVPRRFSIIENPKESFRFLQELTAALVNQLFPKIQVDYSRCEKIDLDTQVLFDIILIDIFAFYKRCNSHPATAPKVKEFNGVKINNIDVNKLLFSVGSPAIHSKNSKVFDDVVRYTLCIHDREINGNPVKIRERKDLDTTKLVDYVLNCLKKLNRSSLSPEKLDDLCTVIGEILINAEEHSTTKYRFSIGYFHEKNVNGKHYGVFRLAILNFGKTIYEKFSDPDCPNKDIVEKMKNLSDHYTKRKYFLPREFEEETLWTLYSLQDGVSSVAQNEYKKRGNGSIHFIESFFNIKGRMTEADTISKMTILSGNTSITFDGIYDITKGMIANEEYKYMTFNQTGKIEDKPDSKYVKSVDHYFPGTLISATILFNEDDIIAEAQNETE